jgi:hypothetical protein
MDAVGPSLCAWMSIHRQFLPANTRDGVASVVSVVAHAQYAAERILTGKMKPKRRALKAKKS